jgi:hypothetical protein
MDWVTHIRARLPDHVDAAGDLAPPWEEFPQLERMTIGWRMGHGEDWLMLWHVFLEDMGTGYDDRLAYLRRHRPAPISWADSVWSVLHPDEDEEGDDDKEDPIERQLLDLGLIGSDVAYATWRDRNELAWPWDRIDSPAQAARYSTRELAFWSRRVQELRAAGTLDVPRAPLRWRGIRKRLLSGVVGRVQPQKGLLTLAQMLCAGEAHGPWRLGLSIDDFTDSFEPDMGYVDAFRLWGMSAFDDLEHLDGYLERAAAPPEWAAWTREALHLV